MYFKKIRNDINLVFSKAFKSGFFHLLSVNFLNQIMSFGTILIVSKLLLPEEFGTLKIIQGYVALFITIASLGLPAAIMKFCSEAIAAEVKYYLLKKAVMISSISGMVIWGIVSMSSNGYLSNSNEVQKFLPIYSIIIVFSVVYNLFIVFLQANKNIKKMAVIQIYIKIISVIAVVVSTFLYGLYGFILSTVIFTALALIPMAKQVGIKFICSKCTEIPKKFYMLSCVSFFSSILSITSNYLDLLILDHFIDDRIELGYYAMATIFVAAALQITGTIQTFLTPYFSENKSKGNWFKEKLIYYQVRITLISVPIAGVVLLIVFLLVEYYYGDQYEKMLLYTAILLVQYILKSMYSVIGIAQLALVREHYNVAISLVSLGVKIFISYFMIISYGIIGIAIAQVLTELMIVPFAIIVMRYNLQYEYGDGKIQRKR